MDRKCCGVETGWQGLEPASPGLTPGCSGAVELHPHSVSLFERKPTTRGPTKNCEQLGIAPNKPPVAIFLCATNSSNPNTGVEIFVPGRGLLSEQYSAWRKRRSRLSARRAFSFRLVRKPGFAPGPSPSQGEMLLLHHNPEMPGRAVADRRRLEPLVGLARTITSLRNSPCSCRGTGALRMSNDEFRMTNCRQGQSRHSSFGILSGIRDRTCAD